MGDVKLAGVMGLFLGSAVAPALLIALLAGVLVGAVIIARKGASEGRKTAVPFGPFLALGALVGAFAGSRSSTFTSITSSRSNSTLKRIGPRADTPPAATTRTSKTRSRCPLSPISSSTCRPDEPQPPLGAVAGPRSGADIVGLDIQPGLVAAVKARVNGSILAERAAALPIAADTVREGEVVDRRALSESLRELFAENKFGKRVRVGIANQRTVMRTLELPPVTDRKELAAAVRFQAQDQVPMPLNNAVLDFHPLGVVDTPAGPRQRVVLVAAQRDMVERCSPRFVPPG